MKSIAAALAVAIVLPAMPARAAPPRESEQSYRELEKASGLDLSREWSSYTRGKRKGSFVQHVDRRFRLRRDLGRGFVIAGASLVVASAFFFFYGFTKTENNHLHYGIAGGTVAVGGGLLIPGAVLLGVYARRLDRLDDAVDDLELGRELADRPAGSQLGRGGVGLRFAF